MARRAIMTKKIDRNEGLKRLIKKMQVWEREQRILVTKHPKYSVDGAIANARAGTISLIMDYAKLFLVGGPAADKAFKEVERKL